MRKLFKKIKKKNSVSYNIETDSIPEPSRDLSASPILIPRNIPIENHSTLSVPSNNTEQSVTSNNAERFSNTSNSYNNYVAPSQPFSSTGTTPVLHHNFPTIQISDSHSFTIGEVHNVTVSNGAQANIYGLSLSPKNSLNGLGKSTPKTSPTISLTDLLDALENVNTKIKDWEISLISEHSHENWQAFGQALDLTPECLEEIEEQSEGNTKSAMLALLRGYIGCYPDTSIGFVAAILKGTGHLKAVEQLAKIHL